MITIPSEEYKEYLRSDTWQKLRSKRLLIDQYKCQRCGSPFHLQVHHIRYVQYLGLEDPYRDLITLCESCHESIEEEKRRHKQEIIAYWDSKKEEWDREKVNRQKRYERHEELIRQFIEEHKKYDTSNVGEGMRNYCDLNIIKRDFYPWMREHGAEEFDDGYISGCGKVQEYFRNRKYEVILKLMEKGYTAYQVHCATLFTDQMIYKIYRDPDKAREALEKEREDNKHD